MKTQVDRNYTLTFTGDRLHQLDTAQNGADLRYSFKLDPTKTPATIDMTVTEAGNAKDNEQVGKTLHGIYALDGDNLKLCTDPNVRPTTFDTKGKGRDTVLTMLKRQKK